MDHLAILSKEKNFLGRILSGEKTIESRWYRNRKPPFKTIAPGDTVYFK
jgi:ASC-1-like (ASCH) protein